MGRIWTVVFVLPGRKVISIANNFSRVLKKVWT